MLLATTSLLRTVVALTALFCSTGAASANWITIKNDTGKPIVVQEIVVVNGQVRRGKPTTLLSGETLREFIPGPTVKRVEVYDAAAPNQAAWSGNLNCKDDNQMFSVTVAGGRVAVGQVAAPAVPKK
ncbi:MAG: hypothetical protein K8U57_22500 [Planctomycetes bacterium]|nr:hypothetical protein [Planctomycetota bacterium]